MGEIESSFGDACLADTRGLHRGLKIKQGYRLMIAISLKNLGYKVCLNIMQISSMDSKAIAIASKNIFSWKCIDVLYFADSFGNLEPESIESIISVMSSQWKGDLGIHTHDNLGLALSNTLRALDEGVTWLDSTVTGMGRGPGNARTEELAIELAAHRNKEIDVVPLLA